MNRVPPKLRRAMALALIALMGLTPSLSVPAFASSHMDAPLITLDPAANTTDVYAFVRPDQNGNKSLVLALSVYPHENPGVGPNKYNFDDTVRYDLHVALGRDVAAGRPTITYRFEFRTAFKNTRTILQSYLGVVNNVDDANQNLTQTYTVKKIDNRTGRATAIGVGSFRRTIRATPLLFITRAPTARTLRAKASRRRANWTGTPGKLSSHSPTATRCSPDSGTTASLPTCNRSSTCSGSVIRARTRKADSTCT